jgi:aminoglycoside phosphotransferase (APT) family kinase protein
MPPAPDSQHVDLERLADWMDAQGLTGDAIADAEVLAGGTQNILVRFTRGGRAFVLRRPPPHLRKNSNETMRREARVLAAIGGTEVPHPGFIAGCPEEDVLGASFYLMEPIDGVNITQGLTEFHKSSADVRRAMGLSLVDGAASLGAVDYLAVGLEGFGKPDGYLERQVARWQAQLDSYSEFENYPGPEIPGVDEVARW